jgi:Xaa-Pro aminopeptidase
MKIRASSLLLALFLLPAASNAQIPESEYAARRDKLAARLGDAAVIAFGFRNSVVATADGAQLPAFAYLTGFHEPDAAMVLIGRGGRARTVLFTDPLPVRRQLYDGFPENTEQVARRMGVEVRAMSEMQALVDSLARGGSKLYELRDFGSDDGATRDTLTRGRAFIDKLKARHPGLEIGDAHDAVSRMRATKSAAELALLRRAIEITDSAHRAALRAVKPGAFEYEVEAVIEHAFRAQGAEGPSFGSIVGSGPNSTTLHYVRNDRQTKPGEVMVLDIGASYRGYAADITRTVPVSGKYTSDQRAILNLVLDAQSAAERQIKPGASAAVEVDSSVTVRLRGLAKLGLIESESATFDPPWPADCQAQPRQCSQGMLWMIHGISHGIGLEVHDPASYYYDGKTFSVGDVFTIEPGIYINSRALDLLPDTPKNRSFRAAVAAVVKRYDNIGARVEDDYVLTTSGLVRLSAGSPRTPDEIEKMMARKDAF